MTKPPWWAYKSDKARRCSSSSILTSN
jgi:hypothetical protein